MRAYKVTLGARTRFEPNQTDARTTRQSMESEAGAKRNSGLVEEVEIPTGKSELLPWLNNTLSEALGKLGDE